MRPPQTMFAAGIALLGKVLNVVLLVVCGGAAGWAGRLFLSRRALPYDAAGRYYNARTGVLYDQQIVWVALGLALLFGLLTGLLLVSAYKLYFPSKRRPGR
ncbi:hypothetical protein E5K00_19265 [Hymenobacter aquaticus]|uniref:Uncharacterized protein n=1 Tax=Hymenobacter aquaticus TaxID=1867101 RepID=A0A4Z0PZR8_9BACT|nr:hypothetical protein [Hymenobacter aquaticus]TGE22381.1 hypothetical protein E5K00_19265 [Hymenobacter aquaticus]